MDILGILDLDPDPHENLCGSALLVLSLHYAIFCIWTNFINYRKRFFYVKKNLSFACCIRARWIILPYLIGLSRQMGAEITAMFWGSFATARGLAIPAAIILSPDVIMWTSLLTALGRTAADATHQCFWSDYGRPSGSGSRKKWRRNRTEEKTELSWKIK